MQLTRGLALLSVLIPLALASPLATRDDQAAEAASNLVSALGTPSVQGIVADADGANQNDARLLNLALSFHHLLSAFYAQVTDTLPSAAAFHAAGYPSSAFDGIVEIKDLVESYVSNLESTIKATGGDAVGACKYSFANSPTPQRRQTDSGLSDEGVVLDYMESAALDQLENAGVSDALKTGIAQLQARTRARPIKRQLQKRTHGRLIKRQDGGAGDYEEGADDYEDGGDAEDYEDGGDAEDDGDYQGEGDDQDGGDDDDESGDGDENDDSFGAGGDGELDDQGNEGGFDGESEVGDENAGFDGEDGQGDEDEGFDTDANERRADGDDVDGDYSDESGDGFDGQSDDAGLDGETGDADFDRQDGDGEFDAQVDDEDFGAQLDDGVFDDGVFDDGSDDVTYDDQVDDGNLDGQTDDGVFDEQFEEGAFDDGSEEVDDGTDDADSLDTQDGDNDTFLPYNDPKSFEKRQTVDQNGAAFQLVALNQLLESGALDALAGMIPQVYSADYVRELGEMMATHARAAAWIASVNGEAVAKHGFEDALTPDLALKFLDSYTVADSCPTSNAALLPATPTGSLPALD